jgi:diguanylate cyclase (GGDEF)-like protein
LSPTASAIVQDQSILDVALQARSALSSIKGYAEELAEDLNEPASADLVDKILTASGNLLGLIQELENQIDSARNEASRDPLTGAANRRSFASRSQSLFATDHALSLILIDVDHFKEVNDMHGHLVGDQVLQIIVERCRRACRETDVVARYAGDEFTILLPSTPPTEANKVAERVLHNVIGSPFSTNAGELAVTVSIGLATRGPRDSAVEDLLHRADEAMYQAKEKGGGQVSVHRGGA